MLREQEKKEAVKVFYDKAVGYRLFSPDGNEISFGLGASVTVEDNFGENHLPTVSVSFICEVVNELPVPKGEFVLKGDDIVKIYK